jgi:hypothetical protein
MKSWCPVPAFAVLAARRNWWVVRLTSFSWLGREFVALQGEGKPALAPAEATHELLDRMGNALALRGLSLDNVVRNRFFGRDEQSRAEGSAGWDKTELVTCFLQRSQNLRAFQGLMRQMVPGGGAPIMEYQVADGWGGTGSLLEVEVTATEPEA